MQGKIVRGVGGFYYVHLHLYNELNTEQTCYECRAKGSFRNQHIKPMVGDEVEIDIISEENKTGNITDILERKNALVRPAVANIDQAVIVFAGRDPEPNYNLLDRFLISMEIQQADTVICFNKTDLEKEKIKVIAGEYEACGYRTVLTSTKTGDGIDELRELIRGKTTAFAGPSGVGKSSLLNALSPSLLAKTGDISEKIKRGKHTTRHSEIMCVSEDTYILDTPGFSSLNVMDIEAEELKNYFREFARYEQECRFSGCVHINEPDCGVKEALCAGRISAIRYDNYKQMYSELKEKRKW